MAYQGYEGYLAPNLSARERAALAIMNRQRKAPQNVGEGLYAIGEAIGDERTLSRLEAKEAELLARRKAAFEEYGVPEAPAAPAKPAADAEPTFEPATRSAAAAPATPVEEGGYNLIDAQAGMGTPGALRAGVFDAIQQQPTSPDMQAYLARQSGREGPKGTQDSPTGAAGPFQFTRGTGQQYGLMGPSGDIRDDPEAATTAARKLTEDNAAVFQRMHGRAPTMADLAVMHQQGGRTGAQMIAGTGNAPARNLAVNNIPPGAGPQQAVAAIKGFYGMPERPIGPRDAVAQTMVSSRGRGVADPALAAAYQATTTPEVSQSRPTMPAAPPPMSGPVPSISQTPGPGGQVPPNQQIAQAPQAALPPNQNIRLAPPPQVMQPPLARVESGRPPEAQMQPPTPAEVRALKFSRHPDVAVSTMAKNDFDRLYKERQEQFKSDLIESRAAQKEWEKQQIEAPKRISEEAEAKAKAVSAEIKAREHERLGTDPDVYTKEIGESQKLVRALPSSSRSIGAVRKAFDAGMFHGSNAEVNMKLQKFMTGSLGMPLDPRISPTEQFTGYIGNIVAQQRASLAGNANVSDADLKAGRETAGALLTLEGESKRKIIDHIEDTNVNLARMHQNKIFSYSKGKAPEHVERDFGSFGLPMEDIVPPYRVQQLHELIQTNPEKREQTIKRFDEQYHTPGLAMRILRRGPPQ